VLRAGIGLTLVAALALSTPPQPPQAAASGPRPARDLPRLEVDLSRLDDPCECASLLPMLDVGASARLEHAAQGPARSRCSLAAGAPGTAGVRTCDARFASW
jgi:hypothetical protein